MPPSPASNAARHASAAPPPSARGSRFGGGHAAALAILLVGLLLTGLLWRQQSDNEYARAQLEFEIQTRELANELESRLQIYRRTLRGAAALFAATPEVSRDEWRRYISALEINESIPGIRGVRGILGIGYAVYLPAAARSDLEARMRREGAPRFRVWPRGDDQPFSSIIYLEPESGRNLRALGFDMHSEAIRRQAMDAATDNGDAALSGVVQLVQDSGAGGSEPGLLLYRPVYRNGMTHNNVASRRSALQGWAYMALRGRDVIDALLQEQPRQPGFSISIVDQADRMRAPGTASVVYRSPLWPARPQYVSTLGFEFSGRRWNIDFASLPGFEAAHRQSSATIILVAGSLVSLALALVTGVLMQARRHAELRAQAMTADLSSANEQLLATLQQVEEVNLRHGAILDNAADAFVGIDSAGRTQEWNQQAERTFGWTRADMLGQHLAERIIPPGQRQTHHAGLEHFLKTGDGPVLGKRIEVTALHRDGHELPVELSIWATRTGPDYRFHAFLRDLTERNRREAELTVLFEQSPDAAFLVDDQGRVQKLNSRAVALFGYAREELLGQPIELLLPESLRGGHVAHRSNYANASRARVMGSDLALSARRKNGEIFPIEVMLAPIETGGETRTLAIARDVTERKQHERAQQKSLREKEVLLQEIHHRVKNNLQVIYSLLDLQAIKIDDEATLMLFRDAQARVHAMALIHQTLYQSQNFAAVDLGSYLTTLLNDLAASQLRPEIRLTTDFETVYLDVQNAVPCGLLVNELLTNAYKHAFPDGRAGTLSVSLRQHGDAVQLAVADDGIGLATDAQTRGTLGMQLVRILAEQLHARLEYPDAAGTCVTLSFNNTNPSAEPSSLARTGES